ncbi:unnamed protein product [Sphagnum balticum]
MFIAYKLTSSELYALVAAALATTDTICYRQRLAVHSMQYCCSSELASLFCSGFWPLSKTIFPSILSDNITIYYKGDDANEEAVDHVAEPSSLTVIGSIENLYFCLC